MLALLVFTSGAAASSISVDVVSSTGSDLNDYDLTVEGNGISLTRERIDSFQRNFEPGEYEFRIAKEGYRDIRRDISVQENLDASYTFSMADENTEQNTSIRITRINSPEQVCRGESFSVDFDIKNTGEKDQVVSTTGYGFGKILVGKNFVIQSGEKKTYRFIFTGIRGSGVKEFRVSASGLDTDSVTGNISVENCIAPGSAAAVEDIETNVYPSGGGEKAFKGEVVRVKGFADGARGTVELNLSLNGERVGVVQTLPDGYFQTFIRPETAGRKTVTVSTPEVSGSAELEVVPDPEVSKLEAPEEVFSGRDFDICADVSSTVTPEVVLTENGDVLSSKQARNRVCFTVQAPEAGEYNYSLRVLTYGRDKVSSKEITVLRQGPEAGSFPGQVSSVETEDSLVKVELYNTNNHSTNYTVRLEGLSREWLSSPVKNVSLDKGQRETVYFYISPSEEGSFDATLKVTSSGKEIYRDTVEVFSTSSRTRKGPEINMIAIVILTLNIVL